MMLIRRMFIACCSVLWLAAPALAFQPPEQGQLGGFVRADTLPPVDQIPAAPLLIAAYAFVWLAVLFYVWTIWRRLNKVEAEMRTLARRSSSAP